MTQDLSTSTRSAGAPTRLRGRLLAALVISCSLLAGGLGAGLGAAFAGSPQAARAVVVHAPHATETASATIDTSAIAKAVDPAVVNINTTLDALEGGGAAAGTGMIATSNGEVITNNHVVQGADTIKVSIAGHGTHQANVIGTDPSADIAVLKLNGVAGLSTVSFGNSSSTGVGDQVVAIGNALGLGGSPTVTEGIISATGRTITASDETGSNEETLHGLLQTDAPIAPGNSGGPLVEANGKVIGMDTAAASAGSAGASLGFAIPANTVTKIAAELVAHKNLPGLVYGRTAFLGIEVVNSSQLGDGVNPYGSFGNPFGFGYGYSPIGSSPDGTPGVVVAAVDPGSPAAKAGVVSGDVITTVDGTATPTTSALSKILDAKRPGEMVTLALSTGSGSTTVKVALGEGPVD
jgi:S1-C subfamily serine protease